MVSTEIYTFRVIVFLVDKMTVQQVFMHLHGFLLFVTTFTRQLPLYIIYVCACVRMCMRACMRACVRVCLMHICMHVCACAYVYGSVSVQTETAFYVNSLIVFLFQGKRLLRTRCYC